MSKDGETKGGVRAQVAVRPGPPFSTVLIYHKWNALTAAFSVAT